MSGTVQSAVRLSRWYACLGADVPADGFPPDTPRLGAGPLTIFRPEEGCQSHRFGDPNRPSLALFDGYLFDRPALAGELGIARDSAESDIVAAAYQRWGANLFEKLHGRYLAAIWDGGRERLLLGHDLLGRLPVYFTRYGGSMWFSSNVLALASSGAVDTRPNRLSLALALLFYWPATGQTFFEAIRRVPDGVYLEITPQLSVVEHDYSPAIGSAGYLPDDQVLEEFEPRLIRAVERCVDLAPEGIMLSGGVDSVVVAALASESLRARGMPALVAVSARSGRWLSHEDDMQTAVVGRLGIHHVISTPADHLGDRDGVAASLDVTRELPGPSSIYWIGAYTGFCRSVSSRGLHTLLTGSGGDDWLSVKTVHAADLIRRLQFQQLARLMRAATGTGGHALKKSIRDWVWTGGMRPILDMWWARLAPRQKNRYHRTRWLERLPSWMAPDETFRAELVEHLMERRIPSLTADGRFPESYYHHVITTMAHPHLPYEFETEHHVQGICGLRLLSPYHDSTLVTFLTRVSPHLLVFGRRYKGLLRPVAARRLPGLGLESQRKTYTPESQAFALGQLRRSIAGIWPHQGLAGLGTLGVVDERGAMNAGKGAGSADLAQLARLYTLLSAEQWVAARQFV
jgi:asparagine synthetase B (glutamine-hydrolysing)